MFALQRGGENFEVYVSRSSSQGKEKLTLNGGEGKKFHNLLQKKKKRNSRLAQKRPLYEEEKHYVKEKRNESY